MLLYLAPILAGVVLSLLLTPLVARVCRGLSLVDAPSSRKRHAAPVPRLGGVAVCVAAVVSVLVVPPLLRGAGLSGPDLRPLLPLGAAAALVFAAGVLDDLRGLNAGSKLAVEAVAALIVIGSGVAIERLTVGGVTLHLGMLSPVVTLLWLLALTNAFNLIDGIDGLAAGVAATAGSTCAAILIWRGHHAEAILLLALVGACVGFLWFNLPPAVIFLGDSGSLVIGMVLATTAITGWQKGATALAAGVPLLIFALPLADLASALVRRVRQRPNENGRSLAVLVRRVCEPDRDHIHHRLLARGWSTRHVLLVLYGATLLLSFVALATARFAPDMAPLP